MFFDNFEAANGWTVNPNATDAATGGVWERGNPEATALGGAKQLDATVSGVNCLVTGALAGGTATANDLDGSLTSVQSPAIALPATGNLTLSFAYYFSHARKSTTADFLRVKVVGSTTTTVLQELGTSSNDDAAWATASASLNAFAGQTVRILIEAADGATDQVVEAAIDDVKIMQQ